MFYRPSPRYVSPQRAAALIARLPSTIAAVGLFVDAPRDEIDATLAIAPLAVLQLHGDESPAACAAFDRPVIKAARMRPGVDLLEFAASYHGVSALMLDTHSDGYGGSGKVFDWSLVPESLIGPDAGRRVILSGGLDAGNVGRAINLLRPYGVDTSSGIEVPGAKGVKDAGAMREFVAAVRETDRTLR